MTTDTIPEAGACCAHCNVILKHHEHPKGLRSDYWECADCGFRFIQASVMDTEVAYRADAIATLQKQCEALEVALADWHKLADQRSEALIKAQQQCEELRDRLFANISAKEEFHAKLTQLQQEVAKLKGNLMVADSLYETFKSQLTCFQQDVKPLLGLADSDDPEWKMKTLATFLTAHPECNP